MTNWIYLSHLLDLHTPAYGGGEGLQKDAVRSIAKGDSCNAGRWVLPNHLGTHIDLPRHFSETGPVVEEYAADFWLFNSVEVLEIDDIEQIESVGVDNLNFNSVSPQTDLLLLKTGLGSKREQPLYWEKGPVFQPELAQFLRKQFPMLRVLGFDTISVSSLCDRETGRRAHKAFLDNVRPILLLEDLDLSQVNKEIRINQVIISPLRVAGADGSPCTVFAEVS